MLCQLALLDLGPTNSLQWQLTVYSQPLTLCIVQNLDWMLQILKCLLPTVQMNQNSRSPHQSSVSVET